MAFGCDTAPYIFWGLSRGLHPAAWVDPSSREMLCPVSLDTAMLSYHFFPPDYCRCRMSIHTRLTYTIYFSLTVCNYFRFCIWPYVPFFGSQMLSAPPPPPTKYGMTRTELGPQNLLDAGTSCRGKAGGTGGVLRPRLSIWASKEAV